MRKVEIVWETQYESIPDSILDGCGGIVLEDGMSISNVVFGDYYTWIAVDKPFKTRVDKDYTGQIPLRPKGTIALIITPWWSWPNGQGGD